jgi:GNAT superfamily N-acetyltransferase
MAVTVQFATEADIPELLQLRLSVDADQARRFGNDRWSTTINEKSVTRALKSSRVLIARRRGRIIGTLRMETKKPWAIDLAHFTPVASAVYLHDVDVDPRVQRSGVGRRLMKHATAVAKEWPVEAIRLDAYDGPSGGGPFYEKHGFTEVGRKVYRGVPLVYFEFLLRPLPGRRISTARKKGGDSAGPMSLFARSAATPP